jgi:glycosyltransferase involved in cell wall biosynthesis
MMGMKVAVIIPVLNEEQSIGLVLKSIPEGVVNDIIVVDNGSTDHTAEIAASLGARVFPEPVRGYGNACLTGIAQLQEPDVVVFLDGDFSDHPEEITLLLQPIALNKADLVIGSRTLGNREKGALPGHSRFGNQFAGFLIRLFFHQRVTDLGPFRAIRYRSLMELQMQDRDFGWTVEMQIKAIRKKLRVVEVPVSYRKRIGKSKISGTISGSVRAGSKILWTICKYGFA